MSFEKRPNPPLNAAVDVAGGDHPDLATARRSGMLHRVNAILADRLKRAGCVLVGVRVAG
jgi:hypothetical protein